jgi:ABC-type transport system involved in multi-copper enzyme maturation permease subunit
MTTTTAPAPTSVPTTSGGPTMLRLFRSELLKITTTNTWWIFALASILGTGIALTVNLIQAHFLLKGDLSDIGGAGEGPGAADAAANLALQRNVVAQAANIFTSGQFFGGLFAMLLAILLITNEYHHLTATTTFLTTPHRTMVVVAKFLVAMVASGFFWLMSTVLSLVAGIIYFNADDLPSHLGDWDITRAMLLNLMVFALWAVFGIGVGALIRNQLGATITATVLYVVGTQVAQLVFFLIHEFWIKKDWVLTAMVIVPAQAAAIAVSPTKTYVQSPPQWVGVAVLVGYGLILGTIGTLIIRKRDIS